MGKSFGSLLGIAAFAAIGGLTGGLLGPGTFSMLGANVGVMIGGMLFAQPQAQGVSSVQDLKANKSDPAFLPIIVGGDLPSGSDRKGGVICPGVVIATAPEGGIVRVKIEHDDDDGGSFGKLFGGQPSGGDTYEHYLSVAITWCEGAFGEWHDSNPKELVELWADDKLIVDINAGEDKTGHINRTPIYDARGVQIGWSSDNFAHYYGTETQVADGVVQSWFEGGKAPAFRGCCYSRISNFRIDDFGHVPQFFARIRDGITERRVQCKVFLMRSNGLDGEEVLPPSAVSLSKISGRSRGWFMTQQGSPRGIAEQIAARSFCALVEHSYKIWDVDLANPTIHTLENWELAAKGESDSDEKEAPSRFKTGIVEDLKLPSRVEVRFFDMSKRDENTTPAIMPTAPHENVQVYDLPCVDTDDEIAVWAQATLDAAWVGRTPGEVTTLPRRLKVTPGDVIRVPSLDGSSYTAILVREKLMGAPGAITFRGVQWNAEPYKPRPTSTSTPRPNTAPTTWAAPWVFCASTVALKSDHKDRATVVFAATQRANRVWGSGVLGEISVGRQGKRFKWQFNPASTIWYPTGSFSSRERCIGGTTRTAWTPPRPTKGYDFTQSLSVEMVFGSLVTSTIAKVRGGANLLLFENGLIISFTTATQTGISGTTGGAIYTLSGIKAGRFGSDDFARDPATGAPLSIAEGTKFVLLRDASGRESPGILARTIRTPLPQFVRAWAAMQGKWNLSTFTTAQPYSNQSQRAPSPLVKASRGTGGSLQLHIRARTRWRRGVVPLVQQSENELRWNNQIGLNYTLSLRVAGTAPTGPHVKTLRLVSGDDGGLLDATISAAQLASWFGTVPVNLVGTVAIVAAFPGREAFWSAQI